MTGKGILQLAFFGLALLSSATAKCSVCGLSWLVSSNGNCYLMVEDPKSFWDAEDYCKRFSRFGREAHLVSVADELEEGAVEEYAQKFGYSTIWIGYEMDTSTLLYHWTDGSQTSNVFWAGGEPSGDGEGCAALRNGHQWNDRGCDNVYPFICKMPQRNMN